MAKERITPPQVMMFLVIIRVGVAIIWFPVLKNPELHQDVWLAVVLGSLLALPQIWVINRLWLRFPTKAYTEVLEIVFGKVLGKVVVLLYTWYWLLAYGAILRFAEEFVQIGLLPRTPMIVIGATVAFVAVVGAKAGIEVIGRAGQIIFPMLVGVIVLLTAMLLNEMQFRTLQPVFAHVGPISVARDTANFIAYTPTVVMTGMMVPFVNQPRKLLGATALAELCSGAVLTMMAVSAITVLGPLRRAIYFHFFSAVSVISVADFLERADSVLLSVWLFSSFLFLAYQLWVAALSATHLLGLASYRPLVVPLAGLGLTYSILQADTFGDFMRVSEIGAITPFLLLIFWLIPFLVLTVAAIRGQLNDTPPADTGAPG